MVAALAGGVPVKGAPLLLTMRLHPMAVLATGRRSLRISTVPCRSWPRGPFARTVHSGTGPKPSGEGGDSSWGHPPALVPPSNGPPRPKFAVSGFGGGRGYYCCCWRLAWWLPPPRDQDCCIPRPVTFDLPPPLLGPPYPPRATSACGLGVTPDAARCSRWRVSRVAQEARTICSTSWRRRKGESSRECFSIS